MTPLLTLAAPAVLAAAALYASQNPGCRPARVPRLAEAAALAALGLAGLAALLTAVQGGRTAALPGMLAPVLAPRLDAVSATMFLLVGFVGWVVVRYARRCMDGETREGAFHGWLLATLAAVMLLVTSGALVQLAVAWIAVSVFLRQLLLHYPDRVQARRAARKKGLTAAAGALSLVAALTILGRGYGTGDIATILDQARAGVVPPGTGLAAALLALAAFLKSAQFPTHGWLTEVMETPTPVSALMHAGVINAGGFLLIRFADVMLTAPGVLAVVALAGGFTALFAGLVMLTQSAVKTSLAWSTVGQMGFMMLQCGLALFPLALLHIVAHSLYKAHAFLAAGMAVQGVASIRRPGPVAVPGAGAVGRAFLAAVAVYAAVALAFGLDGKSPQAIALGAILVFGVAYLFAQGFADAAPRALARRIGAAALAVSVGYFALQRGAEWLTQGTLPATPAPGPLEWALIVLALVSFAGVAAAQAMFPNWAYHPAAAGLRVHLANGLYINALNDRLIGGWTAARRG
jgi:NAD(P)H-quinone oxidoreductase subunit 5